MIRKLLILLLFVGMFPLGYCQWKITNGSRALFNKYPEMVSIQALTKHVCGATLLYNDTVLTAAHCVWDMRDWNPDTLKFYNITVNFAKYDLNGTDYGELFFQVTKVIIHYYFRSLNDFTNGYDAAMLKFDGLISNDKYRNIKFVHLDSDGISDPGDTCEMIGWGSVQKSGIGFARFLQTVSVNIISNSECALTWPIIEKSPSNLCTGDGYLSKSACKGDSGGPLFCVLGRNKHVQVGIIAYGSIPCGEPLIPTVFVRVNFILDWIKSKL